MTDAPDPTSPDVPAVDPSTPARAWVFGDDVDTDQIIPSRFIVSSDVDELAAHAFEDLRPAFSGRVEDGQGRLVARATGVWAIRRSAGGD